MHASFFSRHDHHGEHNAYIYSHVLTFTRMENKLLFCQDGMHFRCSISHRSGSIIILALFPLPHAHHLPSYLLHIILKNDADGTAVLLGEGFKKQFPSSQS